MADGEEKPSILEEVLARHRKEKKELQGKIQALKHSIPKNDKKKKKIVSAEIEILETELEERHKQELEQVKNQLTSAIPEQDSTIEQLNTLKIENGIENCKPVKVKRTQKKRDMKILKEKERQQRIEQQELENINCSRNVEANKFTSILGKQNLAVFEIPSDGNCLYHAFQHQMKLQGTDCSVKSLREACANYINAHVDDFLPFLTKQDSEEPYTLEEFEKYCNEISSTLAWGGHLEIRALSNVFKVPVEIIQAEGPSIIMGEEFNNKYIKLTYHRHAYSLGAHFNSVIPAEEGDSDEFEVV